MRICCTCVHAVYAVYAVEMADGAAALKKCIFWLQNSPRGHMSGPHTLDGVAVGVLNLKYGLEATTRAHMQYMRTWAAADFSRDLEALDR
jgi:hypothetical protein